MGQGLEFRLCKVTQKVDPNSWKGQKKESRAIKATLNQWHKVL